MRDFSFQYEDTFPVTDVNEQCTEGANMPLYYSDGYRVKEGDLILNEATGRVGTVLYTMGVQVVVSVKDTLVPSMWLPQGCRALEDEPSSECIVPDMPEQEDELTGLSSNYYKLMVGTDVVECQDVIEALGLNFAEGNVFKAIWRKAAARLGNGKKGHTALYDAEKMLYFSERELMRLEADAE